MDEDLLHVEMEDAAHDYWGIRELISIVAEGEGAVNEEFLLVLQDSGDF